MNIGVTLSNRLEELVEALSERLGLGEHWIVVQGSHRSWLLTELVKRCGVVGGVRLLGAEELERLLARRWVSKTERRLRLLGETGDWRKALRLARLFEGYEQEGVEWDGSWQRELWEKVPRTELGGLARWPQIHLFAPERMTRRLHGQIRDWETKTSVELYLLSPCQVFWTDERWKRGEEVEGNRLLVRWARGWRNGFRRVEESDWPSTERYVMTRAVAAEEAYQPWVIEEAVRLEDRPMTLLSALQADLLTSRPGPALGEADGTVQVHAAATRYREVEIAKAQVAQWLRQGIEPEQIALLAPDWELYAPYLQEVGEVSVMEALAQLLELAVAPWHWDRVVRLFYCELVRTSLGLDLSDVRDMAQWLEEQQPQRWDEALDGLVLQLSGEEWVAALYGLRQDLRMPAQGWLGWVDRLVGTYLSGPQPDREQQRLQRLLDEWKAVPEEAWPSEGLARLMLEELRRPSPAHYEGLRCGSLQSLAALPAKAVWILGLDETFPGEGVRDGWDLSRAKIPGDEARSGLLQAVLGAREAFAVSFVGSWECASRTVGELLEALPEGCRVYHPRFGLQEAKRLERLPAIRVVEKREVRIKQLNDMVRNPLRAFLRYGVGLGWEPRRSLLPELERDVVEYDMELDPRCQRPVQVSPQLWVMPAVEVGGVTLVGRIAAGEARSWVEKLIVDQSPKLAEFMDYYDEALQSPSPLLPKAVEQLKGGREWRKTAVEEWERLLPHHGGAPWDDEWERWAEVARRVFEAV